MDYSTNLKRRRDSGDSIIEEAGKKHKKATPNRNTNTVPNTVLASAKEGEKNYSTRKTSSNNPSPTKYPSSPS